MNSSEIKRSLPCFRVPSPEHTVRMKDLSWLEHDLHLPRENVPLYGVFQNIRCLEDELR